MNDTQCLLLDCSGSMNDEIEPARSKYRALCDLLSQFSGYRQFAFASDCGEVAEGGLYSTLPLPCGGTDMALAFLTLKRARVRHAVLITDGLPDSEPSALREAQGLRLDIFYVGPQTAPGFRPAFLDRLARATGGTCQAASLGSRGQRQLADTVRARLALPVL